LAVTAIHQGGAVQYLFPRAAVAAGRRGEAVVSADSAAVAAVSAAVAQARAGSKMRTREFLSNLEHDRIVQAIREAESKTSGEIRVYLQRGKLNADPVIAAQKKFHQLRMHRTQERNAVLIFVAPRAHKFAVVGDKAIHEKCGEQFWQSIVEEMRAHLQNEKFSHALIEAIQEIGNVLAAHFPKTTTNPNELPDDLIEG
jgi:uncharacterized membrane protein